MILKGSQRRGANDLALHLLNAVDNESVALFEMRGMIADNLYEGFREWELIGDLSAKTKKPFYSLSINPDPNQRDLTPEEWQRTIAHIEAKLGLTDQPRAIIFHTKDGEDGAGHTVSRRHCHLVWSRMHWTGGQLRAVHLGQDYYKLAACARELAKEFGLELPAGMVAKNDNQKAKADRNSFDFAKSHGKNRDHHSRVERCVLLTRAWHDTQSAEAFVQKVAAAGFVIAQGERRSYVVVDQDGAVHSLARQIEGVRVKDVRLRLGPEAGYPSVSQMQAQQKNVQQGSARKTAQRTDLTKEQKNLIKLRQLARRADQVNKTRQESMAASRQALAHRQSEDLSKLISRQRRKEAKRLRQREKRKAQGLLRGVQIVFGYHAYLRWTHAREDDAWRTLCQRERATLDARHLRERQRLLRKEAHLRQQEIREAQTIKRLEKRLQKQLGITIDEKPLRIALDTPAKRLTL